MGFLDELGSTIDAAAANRAQIRALAAQGAIDPSQAPGPGLFERIFGVGINGMPSGVPQGGVSAPAAPAAVPAAPAAVPSQVPALAATPRADTLPSFAAAGGVSPNVQQALAYFQDKGLSPIAAQGLVGNFMRESGGKLDPNAVNPTGGATGIAQWLGPRAQGLQQFAKAAGRPLNDLRTQLDYAWSELSGPEKATLAALQKATNPLQAAVAGIGYERPEGWSTSNPIGAKDFSKRLAATAGLAGMPASAMAFSGGGAPAMPIATSETSASAAPPALSGPSAGSAPTGGAPPGAGGSPFYSGIDDTTKARIMGLLSQPETRQTGLELWKSAISPKDGYTLGEGQQRYDARNRLVAAGPAKPAEYSFQEVNGNVVAGNKHTGVATNATPADLPQGYRPATPEERKAYGAQDGAPLIIGPGGKPSTLNNGVSITNNAGVNPLVGELGKQFAASADNARANADKIRSIQAARAQLTPGIISGALSNQRLALQKLGSLLGVNDPATIQNTESFKAAVKPIILETVKGLGAGSGISNADRQFAEKAAGGDIELDAGSISRILDINERAARGAIRRHDELAAQMIKKQPAVDGFSPMAIVEEPPEVAPTPATGAPTGGVATVQTPEQARALPKGSRFRTPDGREFIR